MVTREALVSDVMRTLDGYLWFPAALCRTVWRHAGSDWQCCDVIGHTTSYCSPVTDNPADPSQRKEGHRSVCGGGLVSSLSSDNWLTRGPPREEWFLTWPTVWLTQSKQPAAFQEYDCREAGADTMSKEDVLQGEWLQLIILSCDCKHTRTKARFSFQTSLTGMS